MLLQELLLDHQQVPLIGEGVLAPLDFMLVGKVVFRDSVAFVFTLLESVTQFGGRFGEFGLFESELLQADDLVLLVAGNSFLVENLLALLELLEVL